MRKKIVISLIIVFGIVVGFIITNNSSSTLEQKDKSQTETKNDKSIEKVTIPKSNLEIIKLDYEKLNLVPKKSELYFNHVDNDILYLSLLDEKNNISKPLMTTPKLITYNMKTKEHKIYNYNYDIRIWDYIIKNDTIYFTTIEEATDGKIEWSLVCSDLEFTNQKILLQGKITDGLMSPNIILDNDNIYVVTMDEDNYGTRFIFYKIDSDNSIKQLLTIDGSVETVSYLDRVVIDNDNIYYIAHNKIKQFLYKYDYQNNKKDIIFSIDEINPIIFDFLVMDDYYLIDLVNENNKSDLIFKYYDGKTINVNEEIFLSIFEKINNKVLTHNNDIENNARIFKLFNGNGEVEKIFNFEGLSLTYKYLVYDSNYIIIANSNQNEVYIYDMRKLK